MTHTELVNAVHNAIQILIADTSVSRAQTKDDLITIMNEVESVIDDLESEEEEEEEAEENEDDE